MLISKVREELRHCLNADIPVFLFGPIGTGKSQISRQFADDIGYHFEDIRLNTMSPVDLRGIPVPDLEKMLAVWLKPAFFPRKEKTILMLDELSSVPGSLQAVAYQLILERRIGEHVLPKNTFPMGAGNRVLDRGVFYQMAPQLKNRFAQIVVENTVDEWKPWAYQNGVVELIISYLRYKGNDSLFTYNPKSDELAFASPRSWVSASKYMIEVGVDKIIDHEEMLSGIIGNAQAREIIVFQRLFETLPDAAEVIEKGDMNIKLSEKTDVHHAFLGALVAKARESQNQLRAACNLAKFCVLRFPAEIATVAMMEYFSTKESNKVKSIIHNCPEWKMYSKEYSDIQIPGINQR